MKEEQPKRKLKTSVKIIISIAIVLLVLVFLFLFLLGPVNPTNNKNIDVEIEKGTSTREIAEILKDKKLIRSKLVFNVYSKILANKSIKAGYYQLNQSMSLGKIVDNLHEGSNYNPNLVILTFKEGERVTDYAETIAVGTNHTYEEVIDKINDKEYLSTLISKYWFLTDEILNKDIYYPLEGFLAPNTYHFKNKDVEIDTIITKLLDQEEKELDKYKSSLTNDNVFKTVTMASIVELEGTNSENKKMITGVFYNRINSGYNMGSDVTTYYALQKPMTVGLTSKDFMTVNPYNTRTNEMIGKLPVGPICNPSDESLDAVINYSDNDYLFFVADKNGKIYYSKTMKEHENTIAKIKKEGNWIDLDD